jgi:hypothetical protein
MKKLHVSDKLALPLDWMSLATVVYGGRGTGKTCFGRVLAEEVTDVRQRFCAIDLKGDWYGLKSSADGKGEGIPAVIFGGEHSDVPLEPDAGAFVGETVAKLEQSCILDFELFSKGKQIRFLADFFEALYHHNRDPLLLLLDEAQRYAPQFSGGGNKDFEIMRCLGAVQDLVKLGRKHGMGLVLFTQRGAGLNKEVSELCDMLVAFRTPGPLDQGRIEEWLQANTTREQAKEMPRLAGLATGTAVFVSGHPELKLSGTYSVRAPKTFDSSATPKIGQRRREPKKLAEPDLKSLRIRMNAAIERAKAEDPKALRARIAELEKELAKKVTAPKIQEVRVEVPVRVDWKDLKRRLVGSLDNALTLFEAENAPEPKIPRRNDGPVPLLNAEKILKTSIDITPDMYAIQEAAIANRKKKPNGASETVGGGLRRMLIALAQRPQGLTNRQLGVRAGLSSRSGTFSTYLSRARTEGWINDQGEKRFIMPDGLKVLGAFDPLPEGGDLFEYWVGQLPGGAKRMLQALGKVYPTVISNEELGNMAGISHRSGTFSTYLSKLRTLELVEGKGELRMSEELA